jgi:hypothetical protein
VPRFAHCRTQPFFWPMRISSWNQISIGTRRGIPASALSSLLWSFFKARNCVLRLQGCFGGALMFEKPSVRNVRAMVSSLTEIPNFLSTTRTRSIQRQRTTPSRVKSGPCSTIAFSDAFCCPENLHGCPGELSLTSLSMPPLLKACTQSRSVCSVHAADARRCLSAHAVPDRS